MRAARRPSRTPAHRQSECRCRAPSPTCRGSEDRFFTGFFLMGVVMRCDGDAVAGLYYHHRKRATIGLVVRFTFPTTPYRGLPTSRTNDGTGSHTFGYVRWAIGSTASFIGLYLKIFEAPRCSVGRPQPARAPVRHSSPRRGGWRSYHSYSHHEKSIVHERHRGRR